MLDFRGFAAEVAVIVTVAGVGSASGAAYTPLDEITPHADVIAIDGVQLKEFDYVDIGSVIELTNVVPIIIKSLLFK